MEAANDCVWRRRKKGSQADAEKQDAQEAWMPVNDSQQSMYS